MAPKLIPRTVIEVIDDNGHHEEQERQHLELELELPAQNRQEEHDIITITDDEENEETLQPEADLEGEQQLSVLQDHHDPESEDVITILDDEEVTDRQQDIEDLAEFLGNFYDSEIGQQVLAEHQSQPELEAEPQVRGAQARHQPEKAGGSGLKKRQRNFQRKESSLKAKRSKLSFLPNVRSNCTAEVNKRYSCHICDSTFSLRAELKNHIENGQHEMVHHLRRKSSTATRENRNSSTSTTSSIRHHNSVANMSTLTAPSANQNESLEDFLKRYERRWSSVFLQERESNSDPATSEAAKSYETNEEENLDDDSIWIKEQW